MTDCIACKTPLPADARFCLACGVDVADPNATLASRPRDENAELQQRLTRTLAGRYEVKRLLGAGGMASVFLAEEIGLDRPVAIKVIPPSLSRDEALVARFQREAKTAAKLDHPHIIPIYRVESEAGLHYFVMKYVPGRSLESLLDAPQPLPLDAVVRILREAASALGHAHTRGVVHRDVKPANIMLDADDRVVLTDFGISKAGDSRHTQTGMIVGTPHYMAPEQALSGGEVDGRADQYALGVVAYQMLTRRCPFEGDSAHTVIYKHIHERPTPVTSLRANIPRHIAEAVNTALAKAPSNRFATMEEFAAALGGEGKATTGRASRVTMAPGDGRPTPSRAATVALNAPAPAPHRGGGLWVFFGGILVVAAAAGVWRTMGKDTRVGELLAIATDSTAALVSAIVPKTDTLVPQYDTIVPKTTAPAPLSTTSSTTPARRKPARRSPTPTTESRVSASTAESPRFQTAPLTVASEPYGVLYINDVEIGDTPVANHRLDVGRTYRIRVEREGFRAKRETIDVKGPNPIRRSYILEPGN